MIGIIVPLIQEASVFKIKKKDTKRPIEISDNLLLFVSGVGIENATKAVDALTPHVSQLVSWGTAAGLSKILKPGDLLLPDLIMDESGTKYATNSNFESGLLCESTTILKEIEDKEAFRKKFNAMACDMESATIAKMANQRGISFNALRFVSDDYSTRIPKSIYSSINEEGDFNLSHFLIQIISKPKDIIQIIHLGKILVRQKRQCWR